MCQQKSVVFLLIAAIVFLIHNVEGQGPVDDYCVNCICQEGCAITQEYWKDSGSPTVNGDYPDPAYAYQSCYNDYPCSARAIQGYMYRYQRDCNGDGRIDCYDHAAIHRLGVLGCDGNVPADYRVQIENCLSKK